MVEMPSSLRSLFSARIEKQDETYLIEIPSSEIDHEAVTAGETYRVAILGTSTSPESPMQQETQQHPSPETQSDAPSEPPVDEGELRDVAIETIGDQGDGIAKVERGYVVIVPSAQPGDEPTVEIEQVRDNVAFASVVDSDSRSL